MEYWREMGSGVAKKCNYSHKLFMVGEIRECGLTASDAAL